ncbi:MAG TPA: penicillin-binding protein 1C [Humisphaera sp.]|nr:penicillin-binding protein 1C [Humisphaera sp.]
MFTIAAIFLPYPRSFETIAASSTILEDRAGEPIAMFAAPDGQWRIPLDENQISPHLLQAIVAVEDSHFREHVGVDWKSIIGAAFDDLHHLHIRRGGSTITMQLQHLRDPQPRTFFNKLMQTIRARQIEKRASKQQILVEYLNRAPFGGNIGGAGAASWRYFGRPCAQLSLSEAALLAGLPQAPNRLRPDRFPAKAQARRDHVLDRMFICGMIDRRQLDEAKGEPVNVVVHELPQDSGAARGALPTLLRLAGEHPGQMIRTTLDRDVQSQAFAAASRQLRDLSSSGIWAAAIVVLDTQSAECLAAVSMGDRSPWVDLTHRPRSTGSTLKPFIYAAAFDAGICTPQTVLDDSPAAWSGYVPADYDRKFKGQISAAEALADSRNIPAMRVLAQVGVEPAIGLLNSVGFNSLTRSPHNYGLSLAIGGADATPLEMARAYATLARGGSLIESLEVQSSFNALHSLLRYSGGGLGWGFAQAALITKQPPPQPSPGVPREGENPLPGAVLRESSCWQTLRAISNPARTQSVCHEGAEKFVAWKTGTSSGHHDAWCAATTRHRTVIVWLGNLDGEASAALIGQEAAAPLALKLIAALDSQPAAPWPDMVPIQDSNPHHMAASFRSANEPHLSMISPRPGQECVLNDDVPADRQRLLLKLAVAENESRRIWWFVDSRLISTSKISEPVWWAPVVGAHEVRAVDEAGHAAMARIVVR